MTEPTAPIFRALADADRRELLDRLFERDGQTLGELCEHLPEMTRFGVMKHLGVLEEADLVTTVKVGREKRHFLNPVPIRLVHDRWIGKFAEPVVGAMSALKTRSGDPDGHRRPHLFDLHQGLAGPRLAGHHRRRRHRPLLLGTRVASDWHGRLAARLRLSGRLARRRRRSSSRSSPASHRDVVPPALGPGDRRRGPDPDDLARRAGRGRAARSSRSPARSRPSSKSAESFAGGIVYIVSGLKTLLETGEPLAA